VHQAFRLDDPFVGQATRLTPGSHSPAFLFLSPAEDYVMDFRPLNELERKQLVNALRGNAEQGRVLLLDRRDTSFAGSADEVPDEEVISAIKSVPCHY
jgi:hypothetical protein